MELMRVRHFLPLKRTVIIKSTRMMREQGALWGQFFLSSRPAKHAVVIALYGTLGTGKTTFVQGFLRACGVRGRVVSPTFLIFRRYVIPKRFPYRVVYHADLYRIKKLGELDTLGFRKILKDSSNIVLIEWPDKVKRILPKATSSFFFKHRSEQTRLVVFPRVPRF